MVNCVLCIDRLKTNTLICHLPDYKIAYLFHLSVTTRLKILSGGHIRIELLKQKGRTRKVVFIVKSNRVSFFC